MVTRKVRLMLSATLASAMILIGGLPAAADPPLHFDQTFSGAVTDNGEACGFPLAWEFTGEVQVTVFSDSEGNVTRAHIQVRESGTVTNVATGEVVELPRTAFLERELFVEDGSIIFQDLGLSVRVTGPEDFLLDVGRFVVRIDPNELLQSSGRHPIREINPFSVSDPALLGAFCDLFA